MPASEQMDQPLLTAESDEEVSREEYLKLLEMYDDSMRNLTEGEIVPGRVIGITSNSVIIDVGYKSEGLVPIEEFLDRDGNLTVGEGEEVDVLLEKTEDLEGHVLLSVPRRSACAAGRRSSAPTRKAASSRAASPTASRAA